MGAGGGVTFAAGGVKAPAMPRAGDHARGCVKEAIVQGQALVGAGIPLALLGLLVASERLMALGGGAIATVVVGWPLLVLMGAVQTSVRR